MQGAVLNLVAQLEEIRRQVAILEEKIRLLKTTINTLEEVLSITNQKELILPIGDGVFIRATVENPRNVIVDLGENIMAEVSIEKAKEIINQRVEKIKKNLESLLSMEEELKRKIEEIYKNLQKQGKNE